MSLLLCTLFLLSCSTVLGSTTWQAIAPFVTFLRTRVRLSSRRHGAVTNCDYRESDVSGVTNCGSYLSTSPSFVREIFNYLAKPSWKTEDLDTLLVVTQNYRACSTFCCAGSRLRHRFGNYPPPGRRTSTSWKKDTCW